MPEPWKLTRVEAGVYSLIHCGKYLADVRQERDRTIGGGRGYAVWVVDYAMRQQRWRRFEEFATLKEAKAWIGEHLEELAKGESADA